MSKKVLTHNNFPSRLPIWSSLTCWLALDHWNAPQWLYGAMGLFFLIVWGICINGILTEERVDLLNKNDN